MKELNYDLCVRCGECIEVCNLQAITKDKKKYPVFLEQCADCDACVRTCQHEAILEVENTDQSFIECDHCRILCKIKEGFTGACKRYRNVNGVNIRDIPLHLLKPEAFETAMADAKLKKTIEKPLSTAIGAGTAFPDYLPAPYIIQGEKFGVDVITAVSEVAISYSSIRVKVDTSLKIGSPGLKVKRKGKEIGMIIAEEYGSYILNIGGINLLHTPNGHMAVKTIVDIANGEFVELKVKGGSKLGLQVGQAPIVDGVPDSRVKVTCGGGILTLFGQQVREIADELISADLDIIGLMSGHMAGKMLGYKYTGVKPIGRMSTSGNYFVEEKGNGWGGTAALTPQELVRDINMDIAWPGMKIFVVETSGKRAALLELGEDGQLVELPLPEKGEKIRQAVFDAGQPAGVSAVYVGGIGGGARNGVTPELLEVNKAVKNDSMKITVGGAPTYIFPGGNIIIAVDVAKVPKNCFHLTPTPAPFVAIEYTTTLDVYKKMKGFTNEIIQIEDLKQNQKVEFI